VSLLEIRSLNAGYGRVQILWDVSLAVEAEQVVALVGANGAGKTTLLRAISGMIPSRSGSITFRGREIAGAPIENIVDLGIAHVPEGRRLFSGLTVRENLLLGGWRSKNGDISRVVELFPILGSRLNQIASTLSGGEQQMCAIGRALMSDPKLLLLDEPSAGLAPVVVQQVFELVKRIRATGGLTVLIVEQNVQQVLRVVDRAYLLEAGTIRASGSSSEMLADDSIRQAYLGV